MQNTKVYAGNKSGFTGVYWNKSESKWHAQIKVDGKMFHLGYYTCVLNAALARYTCEDFCEQWACDHRNVNRKNVLAALELYKAGKSH